MIKQSVIDEIKMAANIVDVISERVHLVRRGSSHIGLCPFHDEKTPSFNVSEAKKSYKCFGCHEGGDVMDFLQEFEGWDFIESITYLGELYGISIEHDYESEKVARLYEVNRIMSKIFTSRKPYRYFSERGIKNSVVDQWSLGWMDKTYYAKIKSEGITIDDLKNTGLLSDNNYHYMLNRVVFPIKDNRGRVIGFGGRTLSKKDKVAKYMNTQNSLIYDKSSALFGISKAKQAIKELNEIVVVEGYTDVISMQENGAMNTASSSGTAFTKKHAAHILRYTNNATFLFDGDESGLNAMIKAAKLAMKEGLNVNVALLPKDEDPDSFCVKTDMPAWISENKLSFVDYYMSQVNTNDAAEMFNKISELLPVIAGMNNPVQIDVYIGVLCTRYKLTPKVIKDKIIEIKKKKIISLL